jgi:hypothetical protein
MSSVTTCSLTEAMYLLGHGNQLVGVQTESSWPCGFQECSFAFEGDSAQADHESYIRSLILPDFHFLPTLFAAITAVLPKGGKL